jgi:hypothetical protein
MRAFADRDRRAVGGIGIGETALGNHDLAERIVTHGDFAVILAEYLALIASASLISASASANFSARSTIIDSSRSAWRSHHAARCMCRLSEQFAVVRFAAGLVADAVARRGQLVSAAT